MDALFGIPMNTIMLVLLAMLGVSLGSIAYVLLRNRIIFSMAVRNIPRRVAQTVLIVLGLMLSTLIIAAAFTTGDIVDYSISNQAYEILGHVDETVQPGTLEDDASSLGASGLDLPNEEYVQFQEALGESDHPDIDGSMGVLLEPVPVVDPVSGLSEPVVVFAGLDTAKIEAFPDVISTTTGDVLDVASLRADEAYMNDSAADELDAKAGDGVQVWVNNEPRDFTIVDIVEDRVLTGASSQDLQQGMVTRLDTLQRLLGHDNLSFIAISNEGEVRNTLGPTESVEQELAELIEANELKLGIGDSKDDGIRTAEEAGNFMATFFLLLGLFAIGSGMLLIVMIFVMLAAERRSEMGMARAVGTQRTQLVEMFMSEGMAYNLLSAMVGVGLGILVALGMAYVLAAIFASSDFPISIEPHVTPRSLAISYSLGVVLTFLTVVFSSWRVSNLNIVAAIRGTEEDRRSVERRRVRWLWVLLSLPAMAVPPVGLFLLLRLGLGLPWSWIVAGGGLVFGTFFVFLGLSSDLAFPFALGFSLIAAGAARALVLFRLRERPVYTAAGIFLLVLWGLTAGGRLEPLFGPLSGEIEMFFLSGVAMVSAATYVLIYNGDLILAAASFPGRAFTPILPAIKTAIAYPIANRFRTGMTLAMISLVVFALTMMSTMNLNFSKLFLNDAARGGWDVRVETNENNPIPDLSEPLRTGDSAAPDEFRTVGRLSAGTGVSSTEARQDPESAFEDYPVFGMDSTFTRESSIDLDHRARGFESDEAVWEALRTRDDVAIVDVFAVSNEGFGDDTPFDFSVTGIKEGEEVYDPISIQLHDPVSDRVKTVQLIGVIGLGASGNFFGIYVPDPTFRQVFVPSDQFVHYVALTDPDQAEPVADEIEATLTSSGVQAESIKEAAEKQGALFRNFFNLMQAFMGLGLFVGIAAVGVIAFRTVVERRQQIGMLRAIGYQRGTVALSFMLESSFVTLLGILSGVALAIWLSYFLITSDEFPEGAGYHVPWVRIGLVALFTYLASLVMTFIPSRQAASIPMAEALRYE